MAGKKRKQKARKGFAVMDPELADAIRSRGGTNNFRTRPKWTPKQAKKMQQKSVLARKRNAARRAAEAERAA